MDPSVISAGAAVQEREGDKNLVQAGDKCGLTVWHRAQPRVQSWKRRFAIGRHKVDIKLGCRCKDHK